MLVITAHGDHATDAVDALARFVASGFEQES